MEMDVISGEKRIIKIIELLQEMERSEHKIINRLGQLEKENGIGMDINANGSSGYGEQRADMQQLKDWAHKTWNKLHIQLICKGENVNMDIECDVNIMNIDLMCNKCVKIGNKLVKLIEEYENILKEKRSGIEGERRINWIYLEKTRLDKEIHIILLGGSSQHTDPHNNNIQNNNTSNNSKDSLSYPPIITPPVLLHLTITNLRGFSVSDQIIISRNRRIKVGSSTQSDIYISGDKTLQKTQFEVYSTQGNYYLKCHSNTEQTATYLLLDNRNQAPFKLYPNACIKLGKIELPGRLEIMDLVENNSDSESSSFVTTRLGLGPHFTSSPYNIQIEEAKGNMQNSLTEETKNIDIESNYLQKAENKSEIASRSISIKNSYDEKVPTTIYNNKRIIIGSGESSNMRISIEEEGREYVKEKHCCIQYEGVDWRGGGWFIYTTLPHDELQFEGTYIMVNTYANHKLFASSPPILLHGVMRFRAGRHLFRVYIYIYILTWFSLNYSNCRK